MVATELGSTASTVGNLHGNNAGRDDGLASINWERLARSTTHHLQIAVLEILSLDGGRTLSPSEMSQELQIRLNNTNYHVTEVAKAGLIEMVDQRQVRGATEHFYCLSGAGSGG